MSGGAASGGRREDVERIAGALVRAQEAVRRFPAQNAGIEWKSPGDPVTEADRELDAVLRSMLPRGDEGWLSEETADDLNRLDRRRVWIVDPLDGTREFVAGVPEWCIAVGLVEGGVPVAGGICNPATGETILGAEGLGVTWNGTAAAISASRDLAHATILASRSEVQRGEWRRFEESPFQVVPVGSVAYKLARVAAGRADATWTLVPKHEWDVAAGAALVRAAGGIVVGLDGLPVSFNRRDPRLTGVVASAPGIAGAIGVLLGLPARLGGDAG